MSAHLYRIDCLTNMHVGSGDVNFGIIDQLVERDIVTGEPTINASGVKGALKEHCDYKNLDIKAARYIFGGEEKPKKDANTGNDTQKKSTNPGQYKFLSAYMIARPLRVSAGARSHILVTTPYLVKTFIATLKSFGIKKYNSVNIQDIPDNNSFLYSANVQNMSIEGKPSSKAGYDKQIDDGLRDLIGGDYALTKCLEKYALPVVARNQLDKGISNNLWYEEIVPHKSVFYFIVISPDNDEHLAAFEKCIIGDGIVVQFGGNASVGYGYTKITKAAEFNG